MEKEPEKSTPTIQSPGDTVIVEKNGEVTPVKEATDETANQTPTLPGTIIKDPSVPEDPLADTKEDGKKPKKGDSHSNTRFGAGKEKPADQLENPGDSRHHDTGLNPEIITGRKNEYPR